MNRRRVEDGRTERGSGWRWWALALALAVLLWLAARSRGLSPSPEGETHAPPIAREEPEVEPSRSQEVVPALPEEPEEARRLTGRCLDAATESALPGFLVRLRRDEGWTAEARTGGGGEFELRWVGEAPATIEVAPREGWSEGLAARPLAPDELSGEAPLRLLVPLVPRAALRVRVTDARTGQGLAGLTVRLEGGAEPEPLITGPAGEIRSASSLPEGELTLEVVDETPDGPVDLGRHVVSHTGREDAEPHELSAAVGPTIAIAPARGELDGERTWKARILERRGDPRLAGRLLRAPTGWVLAELADVLEERAWSWCTLRAGPLPWFRPPRVEREPSDELDPVLELVSTDGERRGEAPLPTTVGVLEEPLRIEIAESGRLAGEVRDADGAPVADARFWLFRDGGSHAEGPWESDSAGAFALERLDPGPCELSISAPGRLEVSRRLAIAPGENLLEPVVLRAADSAHDLRGRFECRQDHGPGAVLLELVDPRGRDTRRKLVRRISSISPAIDGSSAEFAFRDLAGGTYTLRPIAITGEHRWSPDELTLTLPVPPVLLRCVGDSSGTSLSLEAVDSESGRRVAGQELYLGPVQQPPFTRPESRPAERWYTLPRKSPLTWTVWAPGYQPATGFVDDVNRAGPARPTRVELGRGFGMRLELRAASSDGSDDRDDAPVVPGVEVLVAGSRVGTSDAAGEVLLQLERRPERIDLRHPRWRAVRLEEGSRGAEHLPLLVVWLEPR